MFLIQNVTADPRQKQTLTLPNGSLAQLSIYFIPLQYGWFITNLTYGDFVLEGMRICISPNLLIQFQNKIPFGIACFSQGNREPMLQQDFVSGQSQLYLLDQSECEAYYRFLQTGQI